MATSSSRHAHWDDVYRRPTEDLGWYEPEPSTLELVRRYSNPDTGVIDIGGGDSSLPVALLELGYRDITVLDISAVATERARCRLGSKEEQVDWITADVTDWQPSRTWDLWHDRAVFHFLTGPEERDAYLATAERALGNDGVIIVATFSEHGPERCAGLPVERYDAAKLAETFAPRFQPIEVLILTPPRDDIGDQRPYLAGVFSPQRSRRSHRSR